MNRRFCVFCGQPPQEKTNEHVIPRWLIETTGDPKRPMQLGPFVTQKEYFKQFAFDQFRFPACNNCNQIFSILESRTKSVMESLLTRQAASDQDLDILLDWFDKVRVGLWLGYHQHLDNNLYQINPNFHIADRMASSDRALLIYRLKDVNKGIRFIGVNTPAFAHSPTCFSLVVNDFLFCNVSTDFLLARRAGIPYPEKISYKGDGSMVIPVPLQPGTQEIKYPVLGFNYNRECTVVAQPIIKKFLQEYSVQALEQMMLTSDKIRPIVQNDLRVRFYPKASTLDWLPAEEHAADPILSKFAIQTLRMQSDMLRRVKMWKDEDKALKRHFNSQRSHCIKINDMFIKHAKEELLSLTR